MNNGAHTHVAEMRTRHRMAVALKGTGMGLLALTAMPALAQEDVTVLNEVASVPGDITSPWDIEGALYIGEEGVGALTIHESGTVSVSGTDNTNGRVFVGGEDGQGTVTVTGEDANLISSARLDVGTLEGAGTLTVENGGDVTASSIYIAQGVTGDAQLTVRSGGSITSTHVGGSRVGNRHSSGSAIVTGQNSTWNVESGVFYIGIGDTGELTIDDGGTINSSSANIGAWESVGGNGHGTVDISGEDTT